jgi:hypothetical protein
MKINLNKTLIQPNGKPIEGLNMAEQLADGLANQQRSKNPRKVWGWCLELHKSKSLDLDAADIDLLLEEINAAEGFSVMFKGQLEDEIRKQKK